MIAALVWGRTILTFEYTRTFGPIIKIIMVMVKDMITFLVIWIFVLVFFLCVGMLVFVDVEEFKTPSSAFIYLAQAALGSYDTTIFQRTL